VASTDPCLTIGRHACMHTRMATKTISIDLEAYERLRRARRSPGESFSMVIKRATWPSPAHTAGALLESLANAPRMSAEQLERMEESQQADVPPEDKWQRR
jgi:Putative antitoxin